MVADPIIALDALCKLHSPPGTPHLDRVLQDSLSTSHAAPLCYPDDEDSMHVWTESMLFVLRKAPRLSTLHVDGWRWEHVRDLNAPAYMRK
jgi:hypothetical protein